jgi:predicted signal transduction protein with EAL and GGDEF domain
MGARRARQLAEELKAPIHLDGVAEELSVRAAVGVALWPVHAPDLETLFVAADRAMYAAKREGLVCRVATKPQPEPEITTELLDRVRSTG